MLSGSALTTYTFDANGSQTNVNAAGNLTTMVYDKERRMTSYADLSGTKLSSYNGDGLKASEGSTTIVWDGADYLGEVISGSFAKSIYAVEGQIIAENTPDLQRRDYWLSPLGTVSAAMDQTYKGHTTIQIYKPYGTRAFHSGDETSFRWVGAYGYRPTGYGFADYYVRARHFSSKSANWTTLDPLWPSEWGFSYVNGRPTTAVDFWGLQPQGKPNPGKPPAGDCRSYSKEWREYAEKTIPGYEKIIKDAIASSPCCQSLIAGGIPQFGGFFNESLINLMKDRHKWLMGVSWCIGCSETTFDPALCYGSHFEKDDRNGTSAVGPFGWLNKTWNEQNIGGDKFNPIDNIRNGVNFLCSRLCITTALCNCKTSPPGQEPKPNPNTWPGNRWPYMQGGSDDPPSKDRFKECLKNANGSTGPFPVRPKPRR